MTGYSTRWWHTLLTAPAIALLPRKTTATGTTGVLTNADPGGYIHNPGYVKKVIIDTIDYLDDLEIKKDLHTIQASTSLTPEKKALIMTVQ